MVDGGNVGPAKYVVLLTDLHTEYSFGNQDKRQYSCTG